MFDIRAIRENPENFDKALARRSLEPQSPALLQLDEERRAIQTELQGLQAERNEKSKKIGEIKREGGDAQAIMDEVAALKNRMAALEEELLSSFSKIEESADFLSKTALIPLSRPTQKAILLSMG